MSIYENYTLSIYNDKLLYSYLPNTNNLFEISSNSNTSYLNLYAPEYNFFNTNFGFKFNNNSITYNSTSNYFNGNVYIDGLIDARQFPSKILILDNNNKIPLSYLPDINSGFIYNNDAIGIGITLPESKLHIKSGDAYIENGRLGIGIKASYNFHLDKNDKQIDIPAFVVSSNNKHLFDIYSEKKTIIINDINNDIVIDPLIALNVNGTTKTQSLIIGNFFNASIDKTIINNTLYLSKITSILPSNEIIIDNNADIILNNNSLKKSLNDIIDISNKISFSNNIIVPTINNNNELSIINDLNKIIIDKNNVKITNLITNNLTINNYDSLTSNPYKESVFDIKGKIRLYNDTSNVISNIYMNDNNLLLLLTTNILITYNLISKTFTNQFLNTLSLSLFKTKGEHYAYYLDNSIYINNIIVLTLNYKIIDFAISDDLTYIYIINNNGLLDEYMLNNNIYNKLNTRSLPQGQRITKIDTFTSSFIQNKLIVATNFNNIYIFTGLIFTLVAGINGSIIDIACGDSHALILTTTGVFSFGSNNVNNSKFYRGYSTIGITLNTNQALKIELLNDKFIVKVKAFRNSSIVIDKDGYIYIFGFINRLFSTIMIYKIETLSNIIDFCCNNYDVYLLSYFNDIFTINDINTNNIKLLSLPDNFYGTSIKSRGSIIIGGNNFYSNQNTYLPKNSLLVENFVGIGSNIIGNPKYSLIISGNVNIQNGTIFLNDKPFSISDSTSSTSIITSSDLWSKLGTNLYYIQGNIGIGTRIPRDLFHINGSAIIENNLVIKGKLITNEYKPFIINKDKDITYNGKIGINKTIPNSTLEIYDGDFKIVNVISTSNIIILNNENIIDIVNNSLNTPYINPIIINSNAELIITSYFNNDPNNNNNTIEIYKYYNNQWNTHKILDIPLNNNYFGQSFTISETGSTFYIGAYNEKLNDSSLILTGGIYEFTFNDNNQIEKKQLIIHRNFNSINEIYYKLGENIKCSADGNVLISTINNYNKLLYINNKIKGNINILDFNDFNLYHASFNQIINQSFFNPKIIYIDTNKDGSLIIINFIYDPNSSGVNIIQFPFFNCYIIKNTEIYFLKFPTNYENSYITSLSLTRDGNRLLITTQSGIHFIYDVDFMNINYQITRLTGINIDIKYFDILPNYTINLKEDNSDYYSTIKTYRGKISKSGTNIFLNNYRRIVNYKLDYISNKWIQKEIINNIDNQNNINNYNYDIDYNGHKIGISYIYKSLDTEFNDRIQLKNTLIDIYREQTSIYIYNSNFNINIDTYISSNLYANKIYGDGSNISNIQFTNIVTNNSNYEIIYNYNNTLNSSSNFIWENKNSNLNIKGNIYLSSNLETYKGSIKSGYNIYVSSNLYVNSNIFIYSNLYISSNIYAMSYLNIESNIYCKDNIYANYNINARRNLIADLNIKTLYGSIISAVNITANSNIETLYGSITSASNIISSSNIIVNSNIETLYGSITSASNIIANLNIIGNSNLIINSNIQILNGKIISKSDIISENGNIISYLDLIGQSNLLITSNINTIYGSITSGSNIYAKFLYGDGSNIININFKNIIEGGFVKNGGTGLNYLNSNGILIGNGDNEIIITSNLYWDSIDNKLIFSNNTSLIISNIAPIINVPFISNMHMQEILNINNGGTNNNFYHDNSILFYYPNINKLISSSNLYWSNDINSLYINGFIYGNGSNIINLNPLNIINNVPVIKGGTGVSNIDIGNILIGNGNSNILNTSNLNWNYNTNTLNVSNINVINNLIVNGSNSSNVDANKIVNIVALKNGGLGVSNINPNELIFGFDKNRITSSSNIKWIESIKTLVIDTNLFSCNIYSSNFEGNGYNISNLDIAKIGGIMPLAKGGLGFSTINKSSFIYADDNNKLKEASNVKWIDNLNTFQILGHIDIGNNNFYGNGNNIKNLNPNNILGIVSIDRGGTGNITFPPGRIIFSETNKFNSTNNLLWDNLNLRLGIGKIPSSTLDINGLLKTNSFQVGSTLITSDSKIGVGKIPTANVDISGLLNTDDVIIGSNINFATNVLTSWQRKIGINNNFPEANLDVSGKIRCDILQVGSTFITASGGIQSGLGDISTVTQGILPTLYGGTGISNIENNQVLIGQGRNQPIYQTPKLIWDIHNDRLGIGIQNPTTHLDVNGDINFSKNIYSNNDVIPSIVSFNYSKDTRNILYTNNQLYIGYSNNDTYKLKVDGNVYVSGYITGLSDIRFKTNIKDINDPLDKISKLRGVYYNLLNDNKRSIGLIAQDVESIIPEVVYTNSDNTKSIAYGNMVGLLIESIKELMIKVKKLEEKL